MSSLASRLWLSGLLGLLGLTVSCRGDEAPAPVAAATAAASAPTPAPSAAPKPASRATVGRRRVGLMRNSGSPEGPISYLVVEPPKPAPDTPLVIALHGRGDTADSFAGLAEALDQPTRTIVGRAPIPWGTVGGRAWYVLGAPDETEQIRGRVGELATLAAQLHVRYPEAPKPALYGFSQGAVVALQAACDHPELWSAVIALSGRLATTEGCPRSDAALPVLVVAGTEDHVIPATKAWAAADALAKLGDAVERFEFDGPHRVPAEALAALRGFLEKHALTP